MIKHHCLSVVSRDCCLVVHFPQLAQDFQLQDLQSDHLALHFARPRFLRWLALHCFPH